MKTLFEVHKEGKFFVAVDLLTNGADQGSSEEEVVQNLQKGLEEHSPILIELTPSNHKLPVSTLKWILLLKIPLRAALKIIKIRTDSGFKPVWRTGSLFFKIADNSAFGYGREFSNE